MKTTCILIGFLLICGVIEGQENLKDYDEICYCTGNTPHSILSYDNNWKLLLAFKNGESKSKLDSLGIPYTKSQLKLLSIYKLIRFDNGKYFTTFPILDTNQTSYLRAKTSEIASIIFPIIEKDIKSLVSELNNNDQTDNQFSILFSYVLDGLAWQKFEENGMVDRLTLNIDNYPWVGEFWLLTPRRSTFYGTNSESDSTYSIAITTSGNEIVSKVYNEENELLRILLKNYINSGKVTDKKALTTFAQYNVCDRAGNITIPIITENKNNRIYYYSSQIAEKISTELISNSIFDELMRDLKFKDRKQAVIILYHEVMWDLLSVIEKQKAIQKPSILENPNQSKLADISKLLYITRK